MTEIPRKPFKRLLIANRGEIATRILSSASELSLETHTIYTSNDASHTLFADHAHFAGSPSIYMNIDELISIAKKHKIEAVHPGYGFLSESEEFAARMWSEAGAVVIGPGAKVLSRTGDKLKARALAEECGVPVTPALLEPTSDFQCIGAFADEVGYPIMIKAVDGGGGRGIRLVREAKELELNMKRAIEESPSRKVFAEKAAIDGFRHVEVQIIGDGTSDVRHLWERECSIQRRYQKIVEQAPSTLKDRSLANQIIESALRMAKKISYLSLGTSEFLISPSTSTFYFLEINPRLQVEHTITESLLSTDLVRLQLLIAQGHTLSSPALSTPALPKSPSPPPPLFSIQLRITAEDPRSNWTLRIGRIKSFSFPSGNGIRTDTHLHSSSPSITSSNFDSLLAKLIITAPTWQACVSKAQRALQQTQIEGIHTNLGVLRSILASQEFQNGECDTTWLDATLPRLLNDAKNLAPPALKNVGTSTSSDPSSISTSTTSLLFRKGDAWNITLSPLSPPTKNEPSKPTPQTHHLALTRILQNSFPDSLAAELSYTLPSQSPLKFRADIKATSSSAAASASHLRRGNPGDASHVIIPFPGKVVEFCVDTGDVVKEGDVICIVQQMKMELEVRCGKRGTVSWMMEGEEGEEVGEGVLVAIISEEGRAKL